MPQNKYALARYSLIDSLLQQFDYVKTSLIVEQCQKRLGYKVTPRTIQLDIEAMRHDCFLSYFAPIDYCRFHKAYYYKDSDYQLFPFHFSTQEVVLLDHLLTVTKNVIHVEQFNVFRDIVAKVKMVANK